MLALPFRPPVLPRSTTLLALAACGLGTGACASGNAAAPQRAQTQAGAPSSTSISAPGIATAPSEPPPLGRLPSDVRPRHYALTLDVVPSRDHFSGDVRIDVTLDRPRSVLWLHGVGLTAKTAEVTPASPPGAAPTPIQATWTQATKDGVVELRLATPVPAGSATIHIAWDAPFERRLHGLYRVDVKTPPPTNQAGTGASTVSYAFTQFEAISARRAFPSFDEPAFKTPFDVTLRVAHGDRGIANTRETARVDAGNGLDAVTFATTSPLPTYLLCWAAGPLDVVVAKDIPANGVRKRPLPLRGVAAHGRGAEMGYALEHAGGIVSTLEEYVGIEYPFDKLDLLAVPDRGGAMENAGAITFADYFMLIDPKRAPVSQLRGYASIMAHELAHMWFGDLVTMEWWDDTWLNEAFATWMGNRAATLWDPKTEAETSLIEGIHGAMGADALVSARRIRQPIASNDDIQNAFDGITYQKGAAVIATFEKWVGRDVFERGIHAYLEAHRGGNAVADDFLDAIGKTAGKDVKKPFHTFLDQPGVPLVEARVSCEGKLPSVHLKQSRHLPFGSTGDPARTWQVPVCARYGVKGVQGGLVRESCTLLTETEGSLALDGCPEWLMPNADGVGYFRFDLAPPDREHLATRGFPKLTTRERLALADSLYAALARGTLPAADALVALEPFARDPHPRVETRPIGLIATAREWLFETPLRAAVETYARKLYAPALADVGWTPRAGGGREGGDRALRRQAVISFLATVGRDPAVLKEAARRGRAYVGFVANGAARELATGALHHEAVDPNLASIALAAAVEEDGAPFFDALVDRLRRTDDALVRGQILYALGSAKSPPLAERARALAFDPMLRVSETMSTIHAQLDDLETREAAWAWIKANIDALVVRLPRNAPGGLPFSVTRFCDTAHADDAEAFFRPRIAKLEGGPHNLATALESTRLCAARRKAQTESFRGFFEKRK